MNTRIKRLLEVQQYKPAMSPQAIRYKKKGVKVLTGRNEFTRCQYVSQNGVECHKWFQVDGGKFCPELHRASSVMESKEKFMDIKNEEISSCYKMSYEELIAHIKEIDARIELFNKTEKAKLTAARFVLAEREAQMSEEERKKLRAMQVSPENNGKPTARPKQNPSQKVASKLGVSMDQLMEMDIDAFVAKYKKNSADDAK
jgi:hypothetical protein